MIDPVTGWFEIKAIIKPDAQTVMDAFHEAWLCRYPRPEQIGFESSPLMTKGKKLKELRALTMIDLVTGWFEIKAIIKPDAQTVMDAFQ